LATVNVDRDPVGYGPRPISARGVQAALIAGARRSDELIAKLMAFQCRPLARPRHPAESSISGVPTNCRWANLSGREFHPAPPLPNLAQQRFPILDVRDQCLRQQVENVGRQRRVVPRSLKFGYASPLFGDAPGAICNMTISVK
jgi:hypothetical protein